MSQGLQMLLSSYGFDVKPEMVNEQIVKTASALFKCDAVDETFSTYLRDTSKRLKKISGINCENWSLLKLATALKVIFCPEGEKGDKFCKVLSKDELLKLKDEAHKYTNILSEMICLRAYNKIWSAYRVRTQKKILLESLIKKAKEACVKQNKPKRARRVRCTESRSKFLKSM
ncbi:hypothetical protein HU200_014716 [Digitaria exilis]|uniref:Uncharacterized protein n=1 Tax=Digitaria exilis TaxID=1010633 RepID=A0A835FC52_9POAL|nr:hypothetical protein HU200_014716 [Digitaria exilis]